MTVLFVILFFTGKSVIFRLGTFYKLYNMTPKETENHFCTFIIGGMCSMSALCVSVNKPFRLSQMDLEMSKTPKSRDTHK